MNRTTLGRLVQKAEGFSFGYRLHTLGAIAAFTAVMAVFAVQLRIAAFFAPEGSLQVNDGAPAVGRDAITAVAQGFMTGFPDLRVLIVEKASQPLGKVLISGGGRCNVTHACFDPAQLVAYYPRGGNELRGAFSRFQAADTVGWFEARGVKLKTEADGRMFPVTDWSETIAGCLRAAAKKARVQVQMATSLLGVEKDSLNGFRLEVRAEAKVSAIQTKKLLIATGSDRKTLSVVQSLGHSIAEPVPSLFTFNITDPRIAGLERLPQETGVEREVLVVRAQADTDHCFHSNPAPRTMPMTLVHGGTPVFAPTRICSRSNSWRMFPMQLWSRRPDWCNLPDMPFEKRER